MLKFFAIWYTGKGGTQDTKNFADIMISCIGRFANRIRYSQFTKASDPVLICPGQKSHPANFLRYKTASYNRDDYFYEKFIVPFDYTNPLMRTNINVVLVCTLIILQEKKFDIVSFSSTRIHDYDFFLLTSVLQVRKK
jgi:hypothetical protein